MNVPKFLDGLLLRVHIEIVKTCCPKHVLRNRRFTSGRVPHSGVLWSEILATSSLPLKQHPRKALLQYLDHYRKIGTLRLADEQVDVLRHHDVSDDGQPVLPPRGFEAAQEQITDVRGGQERLAPEAAECYEVEITA